MTGKKRIGVVSDTHGPLPQEVFDLFSGQWSAEKLRERTTEHYRMAYDADGQPSMEQLTDNGDATFFDPGSCNLILHAGDIGVQSALDELGAITRTVAVLGNNDSMPYWCSDGDVRPFRSLTFEGVRIALQHIPTDLERSLHGKPPLIEPSLPALPDLAVHGHTHVPRLALDGDCVLLCPGSPTRARGGSGHHVALIDLQDGRLDEIAFIRLD